MWVSHEALDWSSQRLVEWAKQEQPNIRFKQTLYRLFLLSQLGVNENDETELSITDFSHHCKKYLLVSQSSQDSEERTPRYFVPFTAEYQRGSSGSDWAVGTLWTRVDTKDVRHYLEVSKGTGNKRRFRFTENCGPYFAGKLKANPIPALALALFLLRGREIISPSGGPAEVKNLIIGEFLKEFRLDGLPWISQAFDLNGGPT